MRFLLTVVALVLSSVLACADEAPKELFNKTVMLTWTQNNVQRSDEGKTIKPTITHKRAIYVSTAGRLFAKATRDVKRGNFQKSNTFEAGPTDIKGFNDEARGMEFQGRDIVGTQTYAAGASQIRVTFDEKFSACTMSVVRGKSDGGKVRIKGQDGNMYELVSVETSDFKCEIREGNEAAN